MAQHYRLEQSKEPKVFKSAARIVKYCGQKCVYESLKMARDTGRVRDGSYCRVYYTKRVQLLPDDFNPGGYAFGIGPYDLQDATWAENRKGARVEVHVDKNGKITDIYYPL